MCPLAPSFSPSPSLPLNVCHIHTFRNRWTLRECVFPLLFSIAFFILSVFFFFFLSVLSIIPGKYVFSLAVGTKDLLKWEAVLLEELYCYLHAGRTTEQNSPCLHPSLSLASSYPPWSVEHRAVLCPAIMWVLQPG